MSVINFRKVADKNTAQSTAENILDMTLKTNNLNSFRPCLANIDFLWNSTDLNIIRPLYCTDDKPSWWDDCTPHKKLNFIDLILLSKFTDHYKSLCPLTPDSYHVIESHLNDKKSLILNASLLVLKLLIKDKKEGIKNQTNLALANLYNDELEIACDLLMEKCKRLNHIESNASSGIILPFSEINPS